MHPTRCDRRHLHQLLELPLDAPGLVYKRMETREAPAAGERGDPEGGNALDALMRLPSGTPVPRVHHGEGLMSGIPSARALFDMAPTTQSPR